MENTQFKTVATKINSKAFDQLHEIAEVANVTIYVLLQGVIDAYIKCFCSNKPIDEATRQLLYNFSNVAKSKYGFSFTSPTLPKMEIHKILAILDAKKMQLPELVMIEKDHAGQLVQSQNNDAILRAFLTAFAPDYLPKLEKVKDAEQRYTLTETLKFCIDTNLQRPDLQEEIRQLFLDNKWIERQTISGGGGAAEMDEQIYRRTMDRNDTFEKEHLKQRQMEQGEKSEPLPDPDPLDFAEPLPDEDPQSDFEKENLLQDYEQ